MTQEEYEQMEYYETRASLIFYLYKIVDDDSWRLNNSLNKFAIVFDKICKTIREGKL